MATSAREVREICWHAGDDASARVYPVVRQEREL